MNINHRRRNLRNILYKIMTDHNAWKRKRDIEVPNTIDKGI